MSCPLLEAIQRAYPRLRISECAGQYLTRVVIDFDPCPEAYRHVLWMVAAESDWVVDTTWWVWDGHFAVRRMTLVRGNT